jgi:hypothetical protein
MGSEVNREETPKKGSNRETPIALLLHQNWHLPDNVSRAFR